MPEHIKNPRRASETLYGAAVLIQMAGHSQLAREVEQLAAQLYLRPIWQRIDPRHYRTAIDGQQTDLRRRDNGQWTLEADWVSDTGMRWFRTRAAAQSWVKRKVGAA